MIEETVPVIHDKLILGKKWYFVLGKWSCLKCGNKWTNRKTKIRLSKYKNGISADDLKDNERVGQQCKKCSSGETKLIKYSPLSPEDIKPLVLKHLIFKDDKGEEWYRVFGTWDCERKGCENARWSSAHTYVLLSQYTARVPAADLGRDVQYWGQDCTSKLCKNFRGKLIEYRPLRKSGSVMKIRHKGAHCHKCAHNFPCV